MYSSAKDMRDNFIYCLGYMHVSSETNPELASMENLAYAVELECRELKKQLCVRLDACKESQEYGTKRT